jgi:hypothetical protein
METPELFNTTYMMDFAEAVTTGGFLLTTPNLKRQESNQKQWFMPFF